MISGRVKFFGLVVEMVSLSHTVSLADALDAAANRGLLYALIVTSQHEVHRSVTLTILHGQNPQGKAAEWSRYFLSCLLALKKIKTVVRHSPISNNSSSVKYAKKDC